MKSKIKAPIIQPPIQVEEEFIEPEIPIEYVKPKRQISEQQLMNLAKAREKAKERKKELAELNAKSKGLKEEQMRKDADEFDKLLKDKEKKLKQQELEEALEKIQKEKPVQVVEKPKRKIKKIIYEPNSEEDEEEEEIVVVKAKPKPKPKQPSYTDLTNMSVEKQIKDRLQQEKIQCFFNQLTGKKY